MVELSTAAGAAALADPVVSGQLDAVFHALSDATRRSILRDISAGEKTVGEIARPYPVSLAAVSKHVKVLEAAALVERERRGSFQVVRLRAERMRAAREWLAYYETFWTKRLEALQTHLEGGDDGDDDGGRK